MEISDSFKQKGTNWLKFKDYKNAINWYELALSVLCDYERDFKKMLQLNELEDMGKCIQSIIIKLNNIFRSARNW